MLQPKCSCLNLIFRCFMILCVLILIILSLYYYLQEDVILKTSYIETGAELPSYTICFRSSSRERNELFKYINQSSSFEYFMNISSSMQDFIIEASYQYSSPIEENRTEINFLQNESLWEEAYYIQAQNDEYNGLTRCVRLTSPIERLIYPNDLWVTNLGPNHLLH